MTKNCHSSGTMNKRILHYESIGGASGDMILGALIGLVCFVGSAYSAPHFLGKNGVVIIEAESTSSSKGYWVEKKAVAGYTGESHLEFTGNTPNNGPATSPLKYHFTVDQNGLYHLWIRAYKRLMGDDGEQAREDQCNDCFVRLEGDYDTGGQTPVSQLGEDTKLYIHGKSAKTWDFTAKLDYHDPKTHQAMKTDPVYQLKKGEKYTLIISGRSQRFNMDRIILKHESVSREKAFDPLQPENKTAKK